MLAIWIGEGVKMPLILLMDRSKKKSDTYGVGGIAKLEKNCLLRQTDLEGVSTP